MAKKKTYIYHVLIGKNSVTEIDTFMFARNANDGEQFCKNLYKDKRYDSYKLIKVGKTHALEDTQILPDHLIEALRNKGYDKAEIYREIE